MSISEETHRQFFHVFIHFGSTKFFHDCVMTPTTSDEGGDHMFEMREAGFDGTVRSMDGASLLLRLTSGASVHDLI
jgi:hypothetical protein